MPNLIKIDQYNFELYRFKVGAFFETQCIVKFLVCLILSPKSTYMQYNVSKFINVCA